MTNAVPSARQKTSESSFSTRLQWGQRFIFAYRESQVQNECNTLKASYSPLPVQRVWRPRGSESESGRRVWLNVFSSRYLPCTSTPLGFQTDPLLRQRKSQACGVTYRFSFLRLNRRNRCDLWIYAACIRSLLLGCPSCRETWHCSGVRFEMRCEGINIALLRSEEFCRGARSFTSSSATDPSLAQG